MKIDLDDLERLLPESVPDEYVEYVEASDRSTLRKRGFDPKTLCILNLELRERDKDGWTRNRFFLTGDGCGNYYFVSTKPGRSDRVLLWSHDPPGIEDQQEDLESFLSSATQENRAVGALAPKSFCIARTSVWGESILQPISLKDWKKVISSYDGVKYRGFRRGQNPFTGEELRFDIPGLAIAEIDETTIELGLGCGRIEGNYVAKARPLLISLARALRAKVTVRALAKRSSTGEIHAASYTEHATVSAADRRAQTIVFPPDLRDSTGWGGSDLGARRQGVRSSLVQ